MTVELLQRNFKRLGFFLALPALFFSCSEPSKIQTTNNIEYVKNGYKINGQIDNEGRSIGKWIMEDSNGVTLTELQYFDTLKNSIKYTVDRNYSVKHYSENGELLFTNIYYLGKLVEITTPHDTAYTKEEIEKRFNDYKDKYFSGEDIFLREAPSRNETYH